MKSSIKFMSSLILLTLFAFTATAFAQGAALSEDASLLELARPIFDAIVHGNYWLAASAALVLVVAAVRKYQPSSWKTGLKGDIAGMATAFVLAFAGAVGHWATTQFGSGASMNAAVMLAALKIGATAILTFTALHKLATAFVATNWYKEHAPNWLQAVVALLLKLIGSNAIAKAEAAGDAAVKADPSTGALPAESKFEEF